MGVAKRTVSRLFYGYRRVNERGLARAVTGKTVLVTGASHGIGRATARKLAAAGAHVVLVARSQHHLDDLAAEITADGGAAIALRTNLTDFDEVDNLTKYVRDEFGRVDILVSNAGKSVRRAIHDSYDRFHEHQSLININYLGPVKLTLGLLPLMRAHGGGLLVNVATFATRLPPWPRWAGYQASKSAFDIWLRGTVAELRQDGIRLATVYPGFVDTRMSAPTAHLRRLPPLHLDDAANLVCAAIVRGRGNIGPRWIPLIDGAAGLCQDIASRVATTAHRHMA